MNWYLVILYLIANTLGVYLVKAGFNQISINGNYLNGRLFLGASLYVVSFFIWMIILKSSNLSTTYPVVVSLSIIFVATCGYVLLHETVTQRQVLGIAMVIMAIFLIQGKG
ncbi:EamA family transporter [Desulfotomaculum sp. 1211_IL3151]|uniref:EamA family transporter n=1 Tax=Desulfotomaculum sp. 1211_IL3151 TaxID=3084055 RepID=UPI002FDA59DA